MTRFTRESGLQRLTTIRDVQPRDNDDIAALTEMGYATSTAADDDYMCALPTAAP